MKDFLRRVSSAFIILSHLAYIGVVGITDVKLSVPSVVTIGQRVDIECKYRLENETLYSIKLYKGSKEFLHYIPELSPPYTDYQIKGIHIFSLSVTMGSIELNIVANSTLVNNQPTAKLSLNQEQDEGGGWMRLQLYNVDLFTQGLYGCEVSADFPSWDTQIVRKKLHVLVEPRKQPEISGIAPIYSIGDNTKLTCTVKNTYPAANVTWYFDGKKATSNSEDVDTEPSGLLTRISELETVISTNSKLIVVKCLASLWTYHYQSKDYVLLVQDPAMASVRSNHTSLNTQPIIHITSGSVEWGRTGSMIVLNIFVLLSTQLSTCLNMSS